MVVELFMWQHSQPSNKCWWRLLKQSGKLQIPQSHILIAFHCYLHINPNTKREPSRFDNLADVSYDITKFTKDYFMWLLLKKQNAFYKITMAEHWKYDSL